MAPYFTYFIPRKAFECLCGFQILPEIQSEYCSVGRMILCSDTQSESFTAVTFIRLNFQGMKNKVYLRA